MKANIYHVQANDSMFAGKTLIDYTNMFSPHDFNKNDSIILSYFKDA